MPARPQWALASREKLLAWFRVDSPLREGERELVAGLQASGLEVWLASGDRAENVEAVARTLGIENFRSDCSPADKLELVRRQQAEGAHVAMVGDGINGAPVLAGADVSVVLAEGADIAYAAWCASTWPGRFPTTSPHCPLPRPDSSRPSWPPSACRPQAC